MRVVRCSECSVVLCSQGILCLTVRVDGRVKVPSDSDVINKIVVILRDTAFQIADQTTKAY